MREFVAVGQGGDDEVALAAVGVDVRGQVLVESRDAGVLERRGAQTKLNCWSLAISWISRVGPWAKPSRQPVMP